MGARAGSREPCSGLVLLAGAGLERTVRRVVKRRGSRQDAAASTMPRSRCACQDPIVDTVPSVRPNIIAAARERPPAGDRRDRGGYLSPRIVRDRDPSPPSHMATRTTSRARASAKLEKADLLDFYRVMLLSRRIDDKEIQLKRQNKIFFQISGAGHEAVLAAAAKVFRPAYDWFYTYYRDRALCLGLGMTADGECCSPPSGPPPTPTRAAGRCRRTGATRTSTSSARPAPPAPSSSRPSGAPRRGCATAESRACEAEGKVQGDEVVLCTPATAPPARASSGRRSTRATNLKLPVVFLVEDNGYAISVPVEVKTAGGSISKLLTGFPGLFIEEVDGCDPVASYDVIARRWNTAARARARPWCTQRSSGRTAIRCRTTRSTTAPPSERQADAEQDPLTRFPTYLRRAGHRDARPSSTPSRGRSRKKCRSRRTSRSPHRSRHRIRSTTTSTRRTWIRRPSSSTPKTIRTSPAIRPPWWTCSTSACATR